MTFLSMGEVDRPCGACPRREVTFFVELSIVGEIALRHHAEYAATMDDDCAVVQSVAAAQRSTDHDHGKHIGGGLAQGFDGFKGGIEYSVLQEEIVDLVTSEAQFGEHGDGHRFGGKFGDCVHDLGDIGGRIGDVHGGGAGGDASEPLVVAGVEIAVHSASLADRGQPCRGTTWLRRVVKLIARLYGR